jgi:HAMP domain-containing protein
MSRPVLILIAALVAIVGLLVLLSTRATERPTQRVEKVVQLGNLQ